MLTMVRINVLALAVIGALLVAVLALMAGPSGEVIAIAGAYVGGLASVAAKLAEPDQEPSPVLALSSIIERMVDAQKRED